MVKTKSEKAAQVLFNLPPFELISYVDSNSIGNLEDRKLVMGNYFFIHGVIVFWYSKKQHIISISTTKAEYKYLYKLGLL